MAEQHYLAVLAVIAQGHPVCSVAEQGVSRQTLHAWLRQYETGRVTRFLGHRVSWFRCASQRPVVAGSRRVKPPPVDFDQVPLSP